MAANKGLNSISSDLTANTNPTVETIVTGIIIYLVLRKRTIRGS